MDSNYFNNINDLLVNKREPRCYPNKLQTYKPPLVNSKHFPSRVTLCNEDVTVGQLGEEDDIVIPTDKVTDKSPITYWRRAENSDIEDIKKLIEKSDFQMNDLFGAPDVANLIEKSIFAMVQFNDKQELISFTSTFPYPRIPAVPSFEWYNWLENSYRLKDATPRNSYFIHYMIWDIDYYQEFLRLTLETMFLEYTFLTNILPQDTNIYKCDSNSLQTVLVSLRHSLLGRLKIRLALVEDHDDLMPIVEEHTGRLRELYGDFCMAEIIEYPGTSDRKTLVCESRGYAVGFMNINRAVDFDLLNSQFDLGVFHGLKKAHENDVIKQAVNEEIEERPVYLPPKVDPLLEVIDSATILKFLNWQPSLCASEEDLEADGSSIEADQGDYNKLNPSMSDLVKETLNVKLVPKFSAHSLSLSGNTMEESSLTLATEAQCSERESLVDEESPIPSEQSLISLQYYNLPTYHGPPNAFLIEFFAMHKSFDDRVCNDFLEAAFEVFPDLEYCLLTIPSHSPTFPLLDLFTRVTPRPLKRFRQELYVCHKSAIMITFMRVKRIVKSDLDEIYTLLNGIKNQDCIHADISSSCFFDDSAYQGFALICSKSIVGVAVLCNEYGMEYLAHHYHVADIIDFELHKIDFHAILKHLVLSPIFQSHARYFLRDIMRMADVTSLYRTRYEEAESDWNTSSLITVLGQLIPVKPRRMVKYHKPSLGENLPPAHFFHQDIPFSLYHINSRVCGLKKFISNINVVVVGSSSTAYSFLEALLFAPSSAYVTYNNITLVSPHGMGTELPSHPARDLMFPFKGKYSRFYKIQMCLKTYVHFVYGVMTHINRVDKYITINNNAILPYDYLILLCGRQFVMPIPYEVSENSRECRRNYRPRCSLHKYLNYQKPKDETTNEIYPGNVFLINTDVDATNAFISLQYLINKRRGFTEDEKIIIYGHSISVYLCIQSLLKFGIPAHMIVIVEPFPLGSRSVSCFMDQNIDKAVLKTLEKLNISHYEGYILFDWTFCENKQLKNVTFHSDRRRVTIKCLAMFPFDRKMVSNVTFKAVNEASLVYDGRLVINSNFQTNDSHIYAAGSLTKYQRKYYAKEKDHKAYSFDEVGKHLASIIRNKIDPTEEIIPDEPSEVVPNMTQPLIVFGVLPGDWNYFCVRKPGKFEDPETRASIKEFGDVLITGDCEMSKGVGYFKLLIDDFGFIDGIFCYTQDKIDVENLEMLYGKHEKLLNHLLLRFDLGIIKDFYSYFREPWVYAIFHDQFKHVLEKNKELFYKEKTIGGKEKVVDIIINALKANNWQRPSKEKIREIKQKFEESELKEKITENILDFLYFYDEPFPMYATPSILRVLLHDASISQLHKSITHDSSPTKPSIRISEMTRRT